MRLFVPVPRICEKGTAAQVADFVRPSGLEPELGYVRSPVAVLSCMFETVVVYASG